MVRLGVDSYSGPQGRISAHDVHFLVPDAFTSFIVASRLGGTSGHALSSLEDDAGLQRSPSTSPRRIWRSRTILILPRFAPRGTAPKC
jgi:hypothetical protein